MGRHRHSTWIFLAAVWGALAAGCSIEDWDFTWNHHGIGTGYDGSLSFELIVPGEAIEPRSGHASAFFKDSLWVFGGYNPNVRGGKSAYLADVWRTESVTHRSGGIQARDEGGRWRITFV